MSPKKHVVHRATHRLRHTQKKVSAAKQDIQSIVELIKKHPIFSLAFVSQVMVIVLLTVFVFNATNACFVGQDREKSLVQATAVESQNEVLGAQNVRDASILEEEEPEIETEPEEASEEQESEEEPEQPAVAAPVERVVVVREVVQVPAPAQQAPTPDPNDNPTPNPKTRVENNVEDPFKRIVDPSKISDKDKVLDLEFDSIAQQRIEDDSGYGNHAKTHQGIAPTGVASFQKEGQFLSLNHNNDLDLANDDFSIAFWIKLEPGDSEDRGIFTQRESEAAVIVSTIHKGAKAYFAIRDNEGDAAGTFSSTLINDGNWHHVVAMRNSGRVQLYIDGSLEDQKTADKVGSVSSVVNPMIGGSPDRAGLKGEIDSFRIYKRVLTPGEIGGLASTK